MESPILSALIVLGIILLVWILPLLIIISSSKTTKGEKILWLVAVIFISWFAWILYALLAPIQRRY